MKQLLSSRTVRYIIIAVAVAGATVLPPATISAGTGSVSLCHATSSEISPSVAATISPQGLINGHLGHPEDIIPPFTYNGVTYSQNWDPLNIAIYENNCVAPGGIAD